MLIDLVARRIIYAEGKSQLLQYPEFYYGELFSALSINDRLHALTILENRDEITILDDIPEEYQIENQGLAISTINTLNRHTLMGYYSEWSGYGSTRLNSPDNRTLEFKPISWDQIGYPGPSLGYRAQYKVY